MVKAIMVKVRIKNYLNETIRAKRWKVLICLFILIITSVISIWMALRYGNRLGTLIPVIKLGGWYG